MDQDSRQSRVAVSLATPTALNAQEMSTTAPSVFQDTLLTPEPKNALLKPNAPTAKSSTKEPAPPSATPVSTSTKESAFTEVASMDTPPTNSEVA